MQSIVEAIKIQSEKNPSKLCVADFNGVVYTYSEYWDLIMKIAQHLIEKGIKERDCVIVESFQSSKFTAIGLGIQLAGGVFVPVEKNLSIEKIDELQNTLKAKYIFCSEGLPKNFTIKLTPIELGQIEGEKSVFHEFGLPKSSDLAEILFTTGTTDVPKGVMINHEANVALGQNISYGVQMKKDNIELIPVPINHSYGLRSFYASMYNGSSVVLLDGFASPGNFFFAIEKYSITSLALVPAIINMMFRLSKDYIEKYSDQLDYIQSGSAALSEDAKERLCKHLPNSRLYNFYGSTESGRCCVLEYSKEAGKIGSIGKPAYNASFEIVGDDGEFLLSSRNNVGRLACKGKMNMQGYWGSADETNKTMKDGYILTNDLCYIKDGYIYYMGRKDDVINVGGIKVSPMEIEEVANSHMDIRESVCVPEKDDLVGQIPKLYIVLNDNVKFDKAKFLEYLSESLEEVKIPKSIEVLKDIPKMYNEKIDRKKLT